MAYVEIRKNGELTARRVLTSPAAADGFPIDLDCGRQIRLAEGQSARVGEWEVRVVAGLPPDAEGPADGRQTPSHFRTATQTSHEAALPLSDVGDDSVRAGADQEPPEFEGYRILGRISGRSGQGTVWRAVQLGTRRNVALKFLKAGLFSSPRAQRRFEREVELTASLEHPHIATVYDSGLHQGVYYYAMELIDGVHLDEYVGELDLSRRQVLELMATICRAVQHAHQRGIIHRDLKPSNIMVTPDGQPHVLDFGLARAFVGDRPDATVSIDGEVAGTPAYMSPQQAAGRGDLLDTRTDVYSLGVILFYLLTGEFPHGTGGTSYEIRRRIAERQPRRPRELDKQIDRELESVVLKALAHEPADRYASAGELAADIENYLAGEPLTARPATALYFLSKRLERHWVAVGITLGVVTVLIGMAVYGYLRIMRERNIARLESRKATHARIEADRQRQSAQAAERVSREHLINTCVDNGWRLYQWGDVTGALLWHVQALQWAGQTRRSPQRHLAEVNHRIRVRQLLRRIVTPRVVIRPQWDVTLAALSRDGRLILTASDNRTVRVWDAATGQPVAPPLVHRDRLRHVGFSADGGYVLTTSADQTARVWDARTGKPVTAWLGHRAPLWPAVMDPLGRYVVTAEAADTVVIRDAATGAAVRLPHGGQVRDVCFSRDARWLATAAGDAGARVWDLATGRPVTPPLRHETAVNRVALSPDGTGIVTICDAAARMWETASGRALTPGMGRGLQISHAAFSPDGQRVLTVCGNSRVRVWDTATGRSRTLPHAGTSDQARFSPDGRLVLTLGWDVAYLWDARTGSAARACVRHGDQITTVVFGPSSCNPVAATASKDGAVRIWNATNGQLLAPVLQHEQRHVYYLAFGPQGDSVVTATRDAVRVWDLRTARAEWQEWRDLVQPGISDTGHGSLIWAKFSRDGSRILSADRGAPCVRDTRSGRFVTEPLEQDTSVEWADMSGDARRVVTAGADGVARIWDATAGKRLLGSLQHGGPIDYATFSPDGRRILTSGGQTVRVWDADTGQPVSRPLHHDAGLCRAVFSPDGQRIVTTCEDLTARVWHVVPGGRATRTPPLGHERTFWPATFSPDGRRVLTVSGQGARIWDARTGKPVTPLMEDEAENDEAGSMDYATFSRDGRRVATASWTGSGRVWDAATGKPLTPKLGGTWVAWVAFDPGGRRVVTAGQHKTARVWDAETGKAVTPPLRHRLPVVWADFSEDGLRVVTVGQDRIARVWDARTGKSITPALRHDEELWRADFSPAGGYLLIPSEHNVARIWDVRPDTRSVEELALLAQLHSFRTIDASGAVVPLSALDLRRIRRERNEKYPRGADGD